MLLTLTPFARSRVNVIRVESLRFLQALQDLPHVLDFALEHWIIRYIAQVGKLEMHRPDLG